MTAGPSTLIVGASGQVGHHFALELTRREMLWRGTFNANPLEGLQALDMRDSRAVKSLVRDLQPQFLVIPAGSTNADHCERAPRDAYALNVRATLTLLEAANEVGATLVYFSSDYIFDGADGPYSERSPANPLSHYGLQKLAAEHMISQLADEALIVRTTVVYGWEPQGKNFIYRLLNALRAGQEIAVPCDQVGSPTFAPTLAKTVLDLLAFGARGVFNVAGPRLAARDEFARAAAEAFGENPDLIRAVPTAQLRQPAPRPLQAGLVTDLAEGLLGREIPDYVEDLPQMLETNVC